MTSFHTRSAIFRASLICSLSLTPTLATSVTDPNVTVVDCEDNVACDITCTTDSCTNLTVNAPENEALKVWCRKGACTHLDVVGQESTTSIFVRCQWGSCKERMSIISNGASDVEFECVGSGCRIPFYINAITSNKLMITCDNNEKSYLNGATVYCPNNLFNVAGEYSCILNRKNIYAKPLVQGHSATFYAVEGIKKDFNLVCLDDATDNATNCINNITLYCTESYSSSCSLTYNTTEKTLSCTDANSVCNTYVAYTSSAPTEDTSQPTVSPTDIPTEMPTTGPSESPSFEPTPSPTPSPTADPSPGPTFSPTPSPTHRTRKPSVSPTSAPTNLPTEPPTERPTSTPSKEPTPIPTVSPSDLPTNTPTQRPSSAPTQTKEPSQLPSMGPAIGPSVQVTIKPSPEPTGMPFTPITQSTSGPTKQPTKLDGSGSNATDTDKDNQDDDQTLIMILAAVGGALVLIFCMCVFYVLYLSKTSKYADETKYGSFSARYQAAAGDLVKKWVESKSGDSVNVATTIVASPSDGSTKKQGSRTSIEITGADSEDKKHKPPLELVADASSQIDRSRGTQMSNNNYNHNKNGFGYSSDDSHNVTHVSVNSNYSHMGGFGLVNNYSNQNNSRINLPPPPANPTTQVAAKHEEDLMFTAEEEEDMKQEEYVTPGGPQMVHDRDIEINLEESDDYSEDTLPMPNQYSSHIANPNMMNPAADNSWMHQMNGVQ